MIIIILKLVKTSTVFLEINVNLPGRPILVIGRDHIFQPMIRQKFFVRPCNWFKCDLSITQAQANEIIFCFFINTCISHFILLWYAILIKCYQNYMQYLYICVLCYGKLKRRLNDICYATKFEHKQQRIQKSSNHLKV